MTVVTTGMTSPWSPVTYRVSIVVICGSAKYGCGIYGCAVGTWGTGTDAVFVTVDSENFVVVTVLRTVLPRTTMGNTVEVTIVSVVT